MKYMHRGEKRSLFGPTFIATWIPWVCPLILEFLPKKTTHERSQASLSREHPREYLFIAIHFFSRSIQHSQTLLTTWMCSPLFCTSIPIFLIRLPSGLNPCSMLWWSGSSWTVPRRRPTEDEAPPPIAAPADGPGAQCASPLYAEGGGG